MTQLWMLLVSPTQVEVKTWCTTEGSFLAPWPRPECLPGDRDAFHMPHSRGGCIDLDARTPLEIVERVHRSVEQLSWWRNQLLGAYPWVFRVRIVLPALSALAANTCDWWERVPQRCSNVSISRKIPSPRRDDTHSPVAQYAQISSSSAMCGSRVLQARLRPQSYNLASVEDNNPSWCATAIETYQGTAWFLSNPALSE